MPHNSQGLAGWPKSPSAAVVQRGEACGMVRILLEPTAKVPYASSDSENVAKSGGKLLAFSCAAWWVDARVMVLIR